MPNALWLDSLTVPKDLIGYISYGNTEAHCNSWLGTEGLKKPFLIFQSNVVYRMVYFSVVSCRMLFVFIAVRTEASRSLTH